MLGMSKLYLLAYNLLQCVGWSLALAGLLRCLFLTKSIHGAYAASGDLISVLQTASVLEVLHAAVGLVPSRVVLTLMQVAGKLHLLLCIVRQLVEVQEYQSVFITFMSWSISEVIRYSHYCFTILGACPLWLTYLRYTAFIILYPVGIFPGEMWLMFKALPFIKQKNLYSNFFNRFFLSYHSFIVALLVFYPLLWLNLYGHLLKQRQAKLGENLRKKL